MKNTMTKEERSRNLRYKKPALEELSFFAISEKLDSIMENCSEIHYALEDDETLVNALDGNEEDAWEFRMAFSSLEAEAYQLSELLYDIVRGSDDYEREFNDFSVSLIGNRYRIIGYDAIEEDYFSITKYEQDLAFSEAGTRVMRKTKQEMLTSIGQTLGIILSFHNVEMKYEYLKSTIDIFKDENTSILQTVKEIEVAYEKANEDGLTYSKAASELDRLVKDLPDRLWIE